MAGRDPVRLRTLRDRLAAEDPAAAELPDPERMSLSLAVAESAGAGFALHRAEPLGAPEFTAEALADLRQSPELLISPNSMPGSR